jgi:hypothetical protein
MKFLILLTVLFSTQLFAKRKISNTYYYYCTMERSGDVGDSFKDEYVFLLTPKQEETSIKKNKRWSENEITLTKDYNMNITIIEHLLGKDKKVIGKIEPDGLSYSTPVVVDKELKFSIEDKEVIYRLHCE